MYNSNSNRGAKLKGGLHLIGRCLETTLSNVSLFELSQ